MSGIKTLYPKGLKHFNLCKAIFVRKTIKYKLALYIPFGKLCFSIVKKRVCKSLIANVTLLPLNTNTLTNQGG